MIMLDRIKEIVHLHNVVQGHQQDDVPDRLYEIGKSKMEKYKHKHTNTQTQT